MYEPFSVLVLECGSEVCTTGVQYHVVLSTCLGSPWLFLRVLCDSFVAGYKT